MKCECCIDCYKIDCCDGRCDFECEKCSMNKNNMLKRDNDTKEIIDYICENKDSDLFISNLNFKQYQEIKKFKEKLIEIIVKMRYK